MIINSKFANLRNIHEVEDRKVHPSSYIQEHTEEKPSGSPLLAELSKRRATTRRVSVTFMPQKSHDLVDWLDFPRSTDLSVIFNSCTLPFKWLLWTSKGLSGLTPGANLRERMCNQSTSLGSVAGLYLVVAISAFLTPPHYQNETDKYLVEAYGVIMFASAMLLTVYLCVALTVMYPLLESIPDFAAVQAFRNLAKRWGGYEQFFFNIGCQSVFIALLLAAKVLYSTATVFWMIGVFFVLYCFAAFFTREYFIAIDPITSLHMGICNADDTYNKATRLADEISKQHAAFAEDPETLDEWKAVNYMASPRTEKRRKVFEEHHNQRIVSPRESPRDSSARKKIVVGGGGGRIAAGLGDEVEEVLDGARGQDDVVVVGESGMGVGGELEWSDDDVAPAVAAASRGSSSKKRVTLAEDSADDVASLHTASDNEDGATNRDFSVSPGSMKRPTNASSVGGEHKLLDIEEDTQSTSGSPPVMPRLSGGAFSHGRLPSLQTIFLGNNPLIMRMSPGSRDSSTDDGGGAGSTMTAMDAKKVYGILRKESCRDTQHLITLLRWRLGDVRKLRTGYETELNEKLMSVLVGMGMPVFLAMEVADFMKQYL